MKKKTSCDGDMYGSKSQPIPQKHWEIKTGLLRGNNKNPYDVYLAKPSSEWPKKNKPINCCDY